MIRSAPQRSPRGWRARACAPRRRASDPNRLASNPWRLPTSTRRPTKRRVEGVRQQVETGGAPAAIGPYSQGIRAGSLVYTAGQLGLDPASGNLVEGGVAAQTDRALRN